MCMLGFTENYVSALPPPRPQFPRQVFVNCVAEHRPRTLECPVGCVVESIRLLLRTDAEVNPNDLHPLHIDCFWARNWHVSIYKVCQCPDMIHSTMERRCLPF